jgi:hypothetical protein
VREDMSCIKIHAVNVQMHVINAKLRTSKAAANTGPNVLVPVKMDAQNVTLIIHAANAALDMVLLMECANPVKVTVINAILLQRMTAQEHLGLHVLAHAKEAVMHAVVGTLAPDADQDMFLIMESATLAMVAVNANSFKLLPILTELNVFIFLPLLPLPLQHQLLLLHPLQIITITTITTSPRPPAVVDQITWYCLLS